MNMVFFFFFFSPGVESYLMDLQFYLISEKM